MRKIVITALCMSAGLLLRGQVTQQEFLPPEQVRIPYDLRQIRSIRYSDEKVYTEDPGLREREYIETSGYRIQLIASQDLKEALAVKEQADSLFDLPVYIDFESPNYKVRIGNYEYREAAERDQKRMQQRGFTHAWVVPGNIIIVK